jgi:hypothetical protein
VSGLPWLCALAELVVLRACGGKGVAEGGAPVEDFAAGSSAEHKAGVQEDSQVASDRAERQARAGDEVGGAGGLA